MHSCRHPFASACAAEQLAHACSKLFVAQWRPTPLHEAFLGSAVQACYCRSSQEQQCITACTLATPCGLLCRKGWHISASAPAPPCRTPFRSVVACERMLAAHSPADHPTQLLGRSLAVPSCWSCDALLMPVQACTDINFSAFPCLLQLFCTSASLH
jgi:hypothetical protein